jgi:UDP-2-acetamido-2-deoxy-ribo-hexuluronate aminotransferase
MKKIQMVDLVGQFEAIKEEILTGIERVCTTASYINGPDVKEFAENLKSYTGSKHIIPCANGTDAIQVALMALGLAPGDEVIVPTWTYVASAEVIALLGLKPVFIDADSEQYNIDINQLESAMNPKVKAIVPVHLYGQCCDMEPILSFAKKYNLFVIEDNAQAIGAYYTFSDGTQMQAGTMGHIGTTSFYPAKNLGAYGDAGAIYTQDEDLAKTIMVICNHGELGVKYTHNLVGINSRLDSFQAVVLNAKLKHLKIYEKNRQQVAQFYSEKLKGITEIETPALASNSSHVFHQYTMKIMNGKRDELKNYLIEKEIPSMIYYPMPLHFQPAYSHYLRGNEDLKISETLASEVLSLPIHTEMDQDQLDYIVDTIKTFFAC